MYQSEVSYKEKHVGTYDLLRRHMDIKVGFRPSSKDALITGQPESRVRVRVIGF
jgi:hypothetical protein